MLGEARGDLAAEPGRADRALLALLCLVSRASSQARSAALRQRKYFHTSHVSKGTFWPEGVVGVEEFTRVQKAVLVGQSCMNTGEAWPLPWERGRCASPRGAWDSQGGCCSLPSGSWRFWQ